MWACPTACVFRRTFPWTPGYTEEITLHIPFLERSKARKIRLGVYSTDVTNHQNPHDVFSNVSPIFGTFAGFQRRVDGMVLDLGQ